MGGPGGISNSGQKIGTTTIEELKMLRQQADKYLQQMVMMNAYQKMMSMNGSIMGVNQKNNGSNPIEGAGQNLEGLAKAGAELYKNVNSAKNTAPSKTTSNTPDTQDKSSPRGTSAPASRGGNSYSGLAQGVDTSNSSVTFDTSSLENIESKLENQNISSRDLTSLQSQLANEKVNVAEKLAAAEADFSNIQGQQKTAEANVTRLQEEVGNAETAKTDAQKTLTDNKSQLNQSTKARDQLDDQLASVNSDYKEKCTAVKNCESEKNSAQTEVSTAKTSVAQAESGVTLATQQLTSAQNTLANTPQTINGKPNPQYQVAQEAVKAAENQKTQAETALEKANKSLEEANNRLNTAEENLKTAQEAKSQTLQTLQETDSKYKDMAKRCEKAQNGVENSQKAYDTSLETFDETSANYEKLNTELQSQEGILNQLEVYQTKVDALKQASERVASVEASINEKLQSRENTTNTMLEHANASEGCSASKTPAENLISMKDGQQKLNDFAYTASKIETNKAGLLLVDEHQMKVKDADHIIKEDASFFEKSGCIANSDGSYTNPENGLTWINVGDGTWLRTDTLHRHQEYMNIVSEKYPDVVDAFHRSQDQNADYGIVGLTANSNLRKYMQNWNNLNFIN